jgi:pimeloyl-ACP methyl ester carboxylesterase
MANLFFKHRGNGSNIILIHGFPMHHKVWDSFGDRFATSYTVITPDLPGFGQSPLLPQGFSLAQVAEQLIQFVLDNSFGDSVLIGHSLGGYVALAMVEKRPDLFTGLALFHSTAYADSEEKKLSRNKAIEFIKKNGAMAFATSFIAPLFADPHHEAIEKVKSIAAESKEGAVIGYTTAMRDRPDQTKTLKSFKKPTLFLAGEKDPGIPVESIHRQAKECQKPEIHVISNVAHMAMFEQPEEAASKIASFLSKI